LVHDLPEDGHKQDAIERALRQGSFPRVAKHGVKVRDARRRFRLVQALKHRGLNIEGNDSARWPDAFRGRN
jgi:hypothetical protein